MAAQLNCSLYGLRHASQLWRGPLTHMSCLAFEPCLAHKLVCDWSKNVLFLTLTVCELFCSRLRKQGGKRRVNLDVFGADEPEKEAEALSTTTVEKASTKRLEL